MAVHSLVNLFQVMKTGRPIPREAAIEEDALQLELEEGK